MIMQSAFFKLANVIPIDEAIKHLKDSIVKQYGRKGEEIVNMNHKAVDMGIEALVKVDIPESWKDAKDEEVEETTDVPEFIKDVVIPMNRQEGDKLPVSTFVGRETEYFLSTAAYEKRGIAVEVPEWIMENCIQCNQCSYVCPHAVIRPFLLDEEEKKMLQKPLKLRRH